MPEMPEAKKARTEYEGSIELSAQAQDDIVFLAGSSNPELAERIAATLNIPKGKLQIKRFADGEIFVKIGEVCRGKEVFICQSTSPPVNDNLMELLLMVSTARRASAAKITAIVPYYGYARQDRKMHSRTPISAADVARLIASMGVDRVISVDLHCGQIQGFFPPAVPVDNLESFAIGISYFRKHHQADLDAGATVVSPDAGGVFRAKQFQQYLIDCGLPQTALAIMVKHRSRPNEVDRMDLVGDIKGQVCIIVDDMVDTGGTLCEAARQLQLAGASKVFAFITHGLLNGPACDRIEKSVLETLVITDSVKGLNDERVRGMCESKKIAITSIAPMLAKSVQCVVEKRSMDHTFRSGIQGVKNAGPVE
eukprot:gene1118-1086_t